MLKIITVLLFVTLVTIVPLHAQSLPDLPKAQIAAKTDLKKVFSKETDKLKSQSASIDKKQMEKLLRQQPAKKGLTKNQTIFLVLFAVGVAALIFLVVKYGKDCLRYENDCSPSFDENCYCEEYAPRNRNEQNR